jgi:hypothetical protein
MSVPEIVAKDAEALARRAEREFRAREILAEGRPTWAQFLASIASGSVLVFSIKRLDVPILTQAVLCVVVTLVPQMAIELYYLRRRVEAALVLLRLTRDGL